VWLSSVQVAEAPQTAVALLNSNQLAIYLDSCETFIKERQNEVIEDIFYRVSLTVILCSAHPSADS
jgi:hypothetical protein